MNNRLLNVAQLITATLRLSATASDIAARLGAAKNVDWPALAHHADGHSLTPLLYDVWKQAGVLSYVPPAVQDQMAQAYCDNSHRNNFIRAELLEIHQILTQANVPHLLLKGWSLVDRLYPDPAYRVLYDHDFLVPPESAQAGQHALMAAGFKPVPLADGWIAKHLAPLWRHHNYQWDGYLFDPQYPRPVELHTSLWDKGWRGLRVDELSWLWRDVETRPVAGAPMTVLSDEHTVIHLAMHFSGHLIEGEARLNQLLDLACLLQQSPHLDWERIWAQIIPAGIARFVYAALFLAHHIFDAPLPPPNIWKRLALVTPPALIHWLEQSAVTETLTADYRQAAKGKDYYLTFLAASSLRERLGIIRFAMLPPIGQLVVKYKLTHRWLGPLLYPRYMAERVSEYSRAWFVGL